jgi:hypothetical protein
MPALHRSWAPSQTVYAASSSRAARAPRASSNRGSLQLYLDSASVQQWDRWAASRLFYGMYDVFVHCCGVTH